MRYNCTVKRLILNAVFIITFYQIILKNFLYGGTCCRTFDVLIFVAKQNVFINFNNMHSFERDDEDEDIQLFITENRTYVTVCKDGERREGFWCSTKPCNLLGCHCPNRCEGPCYNNDENLSPTDMFQRKYEQFLLVKKS